MYQKQEIIIDRNSPEAVKFYSETVLPYIDTITSCKLIGHKLDEDEDGSDKISERRVHSTVSTEADDKHIKIVTEENWEEFYEDYGMAQYFIAISDDEENPGELVMDPKSFEVYYPNKPDYVENDPAEFNINRIYNAYTENKGMLKDVCQIRVVRAIDAQGDKGSRVECWESSKTDDFVFSTANEFTNLFGGVVRINNGRTVSLEELPDTHWTGMSPVFRMERLTGNKFVDPSSEMPKYEEVMDQMTLEEYSEKRRSYPRPYNRPLSDELAAEFEADPEWLDELGDRIRYEFHAYDDIFFRDTEIEYSTVVYDVWGTESFDNVPTKTVVDHLSAVEELFKKLEEHNTRFFKKVNIGDYDTCHAHMLFYSKDFALLEAYYDYVNCKMIYTLYDECFSK